MKASLKKGASKAAAATPATPARSWASRDFPLPSAPRKEASSPKPGSMHHRVISRTGGK